MRSSLQSNEPARFDTPSPAPESMRRFAPPSRPCTFSRGTRSSAEVAGRSPMPGRAWSRRRGRRHRVGDSVTIEERRTHPLGRGDRPQVGAQQVGTARFRFRVDLRSPVALTRCTRMRALRQQARRASMVFVLLALAVTPLAASHHRYVHAQEELAGCTTCAVAFHSPTSVAAAPVVVTTSWASVRVACAAPSLASSAPAPRRAGRAPPVARALTT